MAGLGARQRPGHPRRSAELLCSDSAPRARKAADHSRRRPRPSIARARLRDRLSSALRHEGGDLVLVDDALELPLRLLHVRVVVANVERDDDALVPRLDLRHRARTVHRVRDAVADQQVALLGLDSLLPLLLRLLHLLLRHLGELLVELRGARGGERTRVAARRRRHLRVAAYPVRTELALPQQLAQEVELLLVRPRRLPILVELLLDRGSHLWRRLDVPVRRVPRPPPGRRSRRLRWFLRWRVGRRLVACLHRHAGGGISWWLDAVLGGDDRHGR